MGERWKLMNSAKEGEAKTSVHTDIREGREVRGEQIAELLWIHATLEMDASDQSWYLILTAMSEDFVEEIRRTGCLELVPLISIPT